MASGEMCYSPEQKRVPAAKTVGKQASMQHLGTAHGCGI